MGGRRLSDGDDLFNSLLAVHVGPCDIPLDGIHVFQGQLALRGVVAAAFGAEDEELPETGQVVHRVAVPAGRVWNLSLIERFGWLPHHL